MSDILVSRNGTVYNEVDVDTSELNEYYDTNIIHLTNVEPTEAVIFNEHGVELCTIKKKFKKLKKKHSKED